MWRWLTRRNDKPDDKPDASETNEPLKPNEIIWERPDACLVCWDGRLYRHEGGAKCYLYPEGTRAPADVSVALYYSLQERKERHEAEERQERWAKEEQDGERADGAGS